MHIFYGIHNIRLKIIQDKVYTTGTNYTKYHGAWAVILKAIAILTIFHLLTGKCEPHFMSFTAPAGGFHLPTMKKGTGKV